MPNWVHLPHISSRRGSKATLIHNFGRWLLVMLLVFVFNSLSCDAVWRNTSVVDFIILLYFIINGSKIYTEQKYTYNRGISCCYWLSSHANTTPVPDARQLLVQLTALLSCHHCSLYLLCCHTWRINWLIDWCLSHAHRTLAMTKSRWQHHNTVLCIIIIIIDIIPREQKI